MTDKTNFTCSQCSATWQREGQTNCWYSKPDEKPTQPKNCRAAHGPEVIKDAFSLCSGDSEDARIASVAARVEGLCYQPIPGNESVSMAFIH